MRKRLWLIVRKITVAFRLMRTRPRLQKPQFLWKNLPRKTQARYLHDSRPDPLDLAGFAHVPISVRAT
jgi:hypothetical protein